MRTLRRDRLRIRDGLEGEFGPEVRASVKPVSTSERDGSGAIPVVTKFEVTVGPEVEFGTPANTYLRWINGFGDDTTYTVDGSFMPITKGGVLVAIFFVMMKYS